MNVKKIVLVVVIVLLIVYGIVATLFILDQSKVISKKDKKIRDLKSENRIYSNYINEYVPDDFIVSYDDMMVNSI